MQGVHGYSGALGSPCQLKCEQNVCELRACVSPQWEPKVQRIERFVVVSVQPRARVCLRADDNDPTRRRLFQNIGQQICHQERPVVISGHCVLDSVSAYGLSQYAAIASIVN